MNGPTITELDALKVILEGMRKNPSIHNPKEIEAVAERIKAMETQKAGA